MNGSMNSERLQLLIAGYVLGNLDADEAAEFEQIVINDPAIAEEVSQMQSALEESFGVSDIPPPADLRSAILSADQPSERSAIPISSATSKNQSRRSLPWNRIIHVAAAVTIVALGISNYRLWRTLQASVAVAPDRLKAVLTVQNLPPLPPGKVYVLWTVVRKDAPVTRDAKSAILTEVFNVDAQGNISQVIGVPEVFRSANLVSNMAVTIEEAIAPEQHQGKPVLIAS
jgi:hypothetical protein